MEIKKRKKTLYWNFLFLPWLLGCISSDGWMDRSIVLSSLFLQSSTLHVNHYSHTEQDFKMVSCIYSCTFFFFIRMFLFPHTLPIQIKRTASTTHVEREYNSARRHTFFILCKEWPLWGMSSSAVYSNCLTQKWSHTFKNCIKWSHFWLFFINDVSIFGWNRLSRMMEKKTILKSSNPQMLFIKITIKVADWDLSETRLSFLKGNLNASNYILWHPRRLF